MYHSTNGPTQKTKAEIVTGYTAYLFAPFYEGIPPSQRRQGAAMSSSPGEGSTAAGRGVGCGGTG